MLDKTKIMAWAKESEQGLSVAQVRTASQENAIRGSLAVLAVLQTCVEKGMFDLETKSIIFEAIS
jgi:hypothetical protein